MSPELLARHNPVPSAGPMPLATRACSALARIGFAGDGANRLSILIFHRVLAVPDPMFPEEMHAQRFDAQLAQLKHCFNFISLTDGVRGLRSGKLPARAACITFDDGYADNAEVALPILQKHGLPATVFVASGFLDGGRMWNDTIIELVRLAPGAIDLTPLGFGRFALRDMAERRASVGSLLNALKYLPLEARMEAVEAVRGLVPVALPDNLMMTTEQVRQLHLAGVEIGGHTINHPILARMDEAGARHEIGGGKAALETIIGAPVRLFAYPNGKPGQDYLGAHARLVREAGFEAAVSTSWGAARPGSDLYQLPRFTPWDRNALRFMLRMVQNARRNGDTV